MTELKTFGELPASDCNCCKIGETNWETDMQVRPSIVREEAIKWYLACKRDYDDGYDGDNGGRLARLDGMMYFIKRFFELTEADLK